MATLRVALSAVLAAGTAAQMMHGGALPSWEPTYDMGRSTFLMACNQSGSFDAGFASRWGIVDYDWSNWKEGPTGWAGTIPNDCEEKLVTQAVSTKAANNTTKVFVYRNMVKALPWYKAVRDKLVDPMYAGFFLKFNCNATVGCHVPTDGTPFYHDHEQTYHGGNSTYCGVPCGEYLFDHRNGSMLQQWFIDEFVGGPYGIGSPAIDGFFFDDNFGSHGASEEDPNNVEDCGLTPAEAEAVAAGWRANSAAVGKAVLAKGGFAVPFFQSPGRNETDPKTHCAADLRRLCYVNATTGRPGIVDQALLLEFSRVDHKPDIGLWYPNGTLPYFEQDLATFLLVRGPFAWIGYTWSGCTDSAYPAGCDPKCNADDCKPCRFPRARDSHPFARPPALDEDYGSPVGYCKETADGVFEREWTAATVSLDCNDFTARITKLGAPSPQ